MAKQTFTTGSVLTATQMNNLQANDYNWTVSQKSASYVLTAADAGTRIEMNTASNTTVTVNTGLFAAGDTLFIQNIGSGSCVITAGTATVQKSANASLTLSQYQGGYLYFVSTSNAVFFADAGFTSPLTTKGDLFTWDTGNQRLAVGANNTVLTADSTQATGLKWAAVAVNKSYSLLNGPSGTTLSGSGTVTVSSLSGYDNFLILVTGGASSASASSQITMRINGDSGSNYIWAGQNYAALASYAAGNWANAQSTGSTSIDLVTMSGSATGEVVIGMNIFGGNSTGFKAFNANTGANAAGSNGQNMNQICGLYKGSAVISSISLISNTGNFDAGTIWVYGAA